MNPKLDRRRVVQAASGLVVVSGVVAAGAAPANESKRNRSQEVTPPEDLMREHGVLNHEDFERDERRKFGQDGFETMIARVANLEKTLGSMIWRG